MHSPEEQNTTREGIVVRPGQVWEDCDRRMHGRQVRIRAVANGKAGVEEVGGHRRTRISIRSMYPHSTGYRLVEEAPDAR